MRHDIVIVLLAGSIVANSLGSALLANVLLVVGVVLYIGVDALRHVLYKMATMPPVDEMDDSEELITWLESHGWKIVQHESMPGTGLDVIVARKYSRLPLGVYEKRYIIPKPGQDTNEVAFQ